MKALLKIGYQDFLLPDVKTATRLMELLATAVPVSDRLFEHKVVLRREQVRLEMQIVPENTQWLQERHEHDREPEPVTAAAAGHPNRARALTAGALCLQLPAPRRRDKF